MIDRLYDRIRPVWVWWLPFMLFNIGDLLSTYINLSRGNGIEGSPFWHTNVYSPTLIVLKLVVLPFVILPILAFFLSKPMFSLLIRTFTFMLLMVVIANSCGGLPLAGPLSIWQMFGLTYAYMIVGAGVVWVWSKAISLATHRQPTE